MSLLPPTRKRLSEEEKAAAVAGSALAASVETGAWGQQMEPLVFLVGCPQPRPFPEDKLESQFAEISCAGCAPP